VAYVVDVGAVGSVGVSALGDADPAQECDDVGDGCAQARIVGVAAFLDQRLPVFRFVLHTCLDAPPTRAVPYWFKIHRNLGVRGAFPVQERVGARSHNRRFAHLDLYRPATSAGDARSAVLAIALPYSDPEQPRDRTFLP
jgi:hypothetical protein